jgi:Dolichyl-phosphate-mannose-protein mannosyltransferase
MTWRVRPVSVPLSGKTAGVSGVVTQTVLVSVILVTACLALLLTAPVDGDFWWADAPRHALNGVFVKDFIEAHPIDRPVQWAIDYYLRRPALTIMFYPPLFYVAEAIAFALFGVSHFVAQFTVSLFVLLLCVSAYALARLFLPRWAAVGAALLVIGTPETALWGRQVMLDLPA